MYKYESKITAKIATLSYGIYLVHKIVIHLTQTQLSRLNIADDSNLMFLICIAAIVITSLILNETIEKPFLKLRKKILTKKKIEVIEEAEVVIGSIYKKRKQQKLLTNPVAFVNKTEVLFFDFQTEVFNQMIFEFGFNRYNF